MNFIIENDEFFKHFLSENPSNTNIIENIAVAEQLKLLTVGIDVLNTELQHQINVKHKDLLSQASCSSTLERELSDIQTHVESLHSVAEKIKHSINEPYKVLESDIRLLKKVHSTCHILRSVELMQQWLRDLDNTSDQVIQAKIINNLAYLIKDPVMQDIEIVSAHSRQIHLKKQQLEKLAKSQLKQAVTSENITQINTFIQILANLQILNREIDELVLNLISDVSNNIKSILNQSDESTGGTRVKMGPGGATLTTTMTNISKDILWSSLEGLFIDKLYRQYKQIKLLESLLLDISSNTSQYETLATDFWNRVTEAALHELKNSSTAYQNIFEEDYPHILKIYTDLVKKLNTKEIVSRHSMMTAWENVYLSKSLSSLLDVVTEMFELNTGCPTQEQIDHFIRTIFKELSVALTEDTLSEAIAKNVAKAIRSFALKTENIISTVPEAAHTIGLTNSAQQFNIQLANLALYLKNNTLRMLNNMGNMLTRNTFQIIQTSLDDLNQVKKTIISPLVGSINGAIETIILTIHMEPDWNKLQVSARKTAISCSPYMRELIEYIARAYKVHLSPFNQSEALTSCCAQIVVRCIELFVRHSSLVRPISDGGRLRLQVDYREIEQALCVLSPELQTLGTPYRLLKSLGSLITHPPAEIVESQQIGSSVPHSTILLLLFSHASADLQSPHQSLNWTIESLSKWFDTHPDEHDRLELISGTLENYLAKVRKNNVTNYDPVYLLMASLLNKYK